MEDKKLKALFTFNHGQVGNQINGAVILDTRRAKKNDSYPIRHRITYKSKQVYFQSGYSATLSEWERLPDTKSSKLLKLRKGIEDGFDILDTYCKEIKENFTFEALNNRLGRGRTEFVADAFDQKINELKKNGQPGTAMIYNCAKNAILSFKPNLKFKDITPKTLESFELETSKKIKTATIAMYLRCLRTIYNIAIGEGIIQPSTYPFQKNQNDGKYQIKQGTGTKKALTVDELAKFIQYEPIYEGMKRSKDLFLLSFHLGGINIKDMLLMKWENIQQNELVYTRSKTVRTSLKETKIRIPLSDDAIQIIEKWGNADKSPKARILPLLPIDATPQEIRDKTLIVTKKINKDLHKISDQINIDDLTSYVARHTLATLMKNSGVSESFIKETLGHANIKTTQNYLKSFEKEQRRETFDMVESVVKKAVANKTIN